MAMNENSAAAKIIANLGGLSGSVEQKNSAEKQIKAICKGILDEIKANGVVSTVDTSGDTGTGSIS